MASQPAAAAAAAPVQTATAIQPADAPTDPLEQRILDLLYPYRDECYSHINLQGPFAEEERKAWILCGNLAFMIRHNQNSYGKKIITDDISVASYNWDGMVRGMGMAGIGVFVNGNGFTHTIARTNIQPGESVVHNLMRVVDRSLMAFFPET